MPRDKIEGLHRCSSVGPRQGVACPRRDLAEKRLEQASGTPRHSRATPRRSTIHNMEIFGVLFCFVFPLLRGLVYWTNEDPISV